MSGCLNVAITHDDRIVRSVHGPLINAVSVLHCAGIVVSLPSLLPIPGLKTWPTLEAMLQDEEVHIVLVTTPLSDRSRTIQECLRAGKHVLSHVPLAQTAAETSSLVNLSRTSGRLLCPMFMHRYNGDYNTLSALRMQKYGKPLGKWERWTINDLEPAPSNANDGDSLERSSRCVDQVHHFFGMPESVVGGTERMVLTYAGGLAVEIDLAAQNHERQYVIHGEKGTYEKRFIDPQFKQLSAGMSPLDKHFGRETDEHYGVLCLDSHTESYPTIKTPTWRGLYQDFALAVRGEQQNPCAPEDALSVQLIIERARAGAAKNVGNVMMQSH